VAIQDEDSKELVKLVEKVIITYVDAQSFLPFNTCVAVQGNDFSCFQ
jgi:hypothetical protein